MFFLSLILINFSQAQSREEDKRHGQVVGPSQDMDAHTFYLKYMFVEGEICSKVKDEW